MTCKCYHAERNFLGKIGVCWGTKECEACSCGGDESKCDFYEYVRERAKKPTTGYEELVRSLRTTVNLYEPVGQGGLVTTQLIKQAADAIEELQEDNAALNGTVSNLIGQIVELSKPRWIPVTERLPDETGNYLTAFEDGTAKNIGGKK